MLMFILLRSAFLNTRNIPLKFYFIMKYKCLPSDISSISGLGLKFKKKFLGTLAIYLLVLVPRYNKFYYILLLFLHNHFNTTTLLPYLYVLNTEPRR